MTHRARALTLLTLSLCACDLDQIAESFELSELPPSVLLEIDAGDEVRLRSAILRLRLLRLDTLPSAGESIPMPTRSADYEVFHFPERILLPEDIVSAGAGFWVEVSALDIQGNVLTSARLITNPLPERTLLPALVLSDACLNVICGALTSTCGAEGRCRTAQRAPEDLPSEPWE